MTIQYYTKKDFTEVLRHLGRYRFENNFIGSLK